MHGNSVTVYYWYHKHNLSFMNLCKIVTVDQNRTITRFLLTVYSVMIYTSCVLIFIMIFI